MNSVKAVNGVIAVFHHNYNVHINVEGKNRTKRISVPVSDDGLAT